MSHSHHVRCAIVRVLTTAALLGAAAAGGCAGPLNQQDGPLGDQPSDLPDLAAVPADPGLDHEPTLFMEDTAWPHEGMLLDYLAKAEAQYAPSLVESRGRGTAILELHTLLHTAWGTGQRAEVLLWQKILDPTRLWNLLATELPPEGKAPGTWMNDALAVRDDWRSRLLRTARWSPLS